MKRLMLILIIVAILITGCGDDTVAEKCAKDCRKANAAFYGVTEVSRHQHQCWCVRDGAKFQIW